MSECQRMFIGWLRPLQGLTTNEHILLCKQLTLNSVAKEQVLWFDGKKMNLNWPIGVMLRNIEQTFKIHSNGWNLDVLIHSVKKKSVTDRCGRFSGNDALDYFAKDIPKGNEFLKRWSHINSQTTYIKQHKHVGFMPRNVIDHHQLIIEGDLSLFCNGKIIPRNDDGH